MTHPINNKVGHFKIDRRIIDTQPKKIKTIMSHMVIMRAEMMGHSDAVEYIARSDLFESVDAGHIFGYTINTYDIAVDVDGVVTATRERTPDKPK